MPRRLVTSRQVVSHTTKRTLARTIFGLVLLCGWSPAARAQTDSVALWTVALQSGTVAAKQLAVDGLSRIPTVSLPTLTVQALIGELNRVHQALMVGADPGTPDLSEDHSDYYTSLVGIVVGLRTPAAALALVPAIEVSGAAQRRVARYGGDTVVAALANLVAKRFSPDDALETLGLVWFWSDSTGSALSDASRSTIIATLAASALTGDDEDMLGVSAALRDVKNPSFLALSQVLRGVAVAQGSLGLFTVHRLDEDVLPVLTAAAATRSNAELVRAIGRMAAAACASPASGQRRGLCQSTSNQLANAATHFDLGQFGPARNVYSSVADKFASARNDGTFTAAEYALISGDLVTLLGRSW